MNKIEARKKYLDLRKKLDNVQIISKSISISNNLQDLPIWGYNFYHIYLPIKEKNEVDTMPIINILNNKKKKVLIPKSDFKNTTNTDNQIITNGIEVGHIFYFGTKYSEAFNANFINKKGSKELIHSGSYGIGISRLVAAIIEANNDERGIIWPKQVTPYDIGLINVRSDNEISNKFSEDFYKKFKKKYDVIYDDRDVRVGDKFNNMDLLGIPLQIIAGEKNLLNSSIEIKERKTGKTELISIDKVESYLEYKCEF